MTAWAVPCWLVQGRWPHDDGPTYRTASESDARHIAAVLTTAGARAVTIPPPRPADLKELRS